MKSCGALHGPVLKLVSVRGKSMGRKNRRGIWMANQPAIIVNIFGIHSLSHRVEVRARLVASLTMSLRRYSVNKKMATPGLARKVCRHVYVFV